MTNSSEIPHDAARSEVVAQRDELTWKSGWEIRDLIVKRAVSASEVTEHFLARISALDPLLHAFRSVDAQGARQQARHLDSRLANGETPGPLHGIPIAIKEEIKVAGSFFPPEGRVADEDSIFVERLRAAGAVIIGTTMTPGMGNWPGQKMFYGVDAPGDLNLHPRNPWDLACVPGSSSAGSAAAVAAGLVPVAIGRDGGGSTRLPAALCGVIGVHPTQGRVPSVSYRSSALELTGTDGPIARDARDAAIVMQAVSGPDGRDFICIQDELDYLSNLEAGIEGLRCAWTPDFGLGELYGSWHMPAVLDAVKRAAQQVGSMGASFVETGEVWEDFWPAYMFTTQHYRQHYGPAAHGAETSIDEHAQGLKAALALRQRSLDKFLALFKDHDLLLSPTIGFTAPTVAAWDNAWSRDAANNPHGTFAPNYTSNTHMHNWLGLPAVSIPCGFVGGLPIALQLTARPGANRCCSGPHLRSSKPSRAWNDPRSDRQVSPRDLRPVPTAMTHCRLGRSCRGSTRSSP